MILDLTRGNNHKHLKVIAKQSYGDGRLNQQQAVGTTHDFTPITNKGQKSEIRLERFQNRIMRDGINVCFDYRSAELEPD